jgi:hypothetical protein
MLLEKRDNRRSRKVIDLNAPHVASLSNRVGEVGWLKEENDRKEQFGGSCDPAPFAEDRFLDPVGSQGDLRAAKGRVRGVGRRG